jgi:hypothetical protein
MAQWIIGYVAGAYNSMDAIPLQTSGPIRRIVSGFYISDDATGAVALTPVQTANADGEVQISGRVNCKIHQAGLTDVVVFLFCETELGVGEGAGTPHAITP